MKPGTWIGITVIVSALIFGGVLFVKGITPYVTFEDARRAKGDTVQVMGKLDKTSIRYTVDKSIRFTLIGDTGDRLPVVFAASRPANFEEAVQVTAIGSYDGSLFRADNLLVKCPSKYQGDGAERNYAGTKPASL